MPKKPKPTYVHNCGACRFLGIDKPRLPEERAEVDMYIHAGPDFYTLTRRYGDDENDFNYENFSPFSMSTMIHVAWLPLIKCISN